MMRPGIRMPLDHQIYNQINEVRGNMTQLDEEILTLQRKRDNLKLRMPNIVAQCEPGMAKVDEVAERGGVVKAEEDIVAPEAVVAEAVESVVCADNTGEVSGANNKMFGAEEPSGVLEQSVATGKVKVYELEEMVASKSQKIVISEKTVIIAEQMEEVSQMAEQSASDEEAVEDIRTSVVEILEE